MRVRSEHSLHCRDGWFVVADLQAIDREPQLAFQGGPPRRYKVHRRRDVVVLDFAPRVFRAGGRLDFEHIGNLEVTSSRIGIWNASHDLLPGAQAIVSDNRGVLLPSAYEHLKVWIEAKDFGTTVFGGIICVGPRVELLLSGDDATTIHRLERDAAKVLRMKGQDKQVGLKVLRDQILQLHLDGCNDGRLKMLASALKLKLLIVVGSSQAADPPSVTGSPNPSMNRTPSYSARLGRCRVGLTMITSSSRCHRGAGYLTTR